MRDRNPSLSAPVCWIGIQTLVAGLIVLLTGCRGTATQSEKTARRNATALSADFRPDGKRPELPTLHPTSGLSNYVEYALLNQPKVEAAYYDWMTAVERITTERSLPDPTLGFQTDISDVVMTVMPGIMQVLPGPGKLRARANLAAARSQVLYFVFESAVLQTAFEVKRSFYELHLLDERIRINEENLVLLREFEAIARAQNEAGKVTLQDVLRAQILRDSVVTELANLEDSRRPRLAAFKAALGLVREEADPPVPTELESTELDLDADKLLDVAFERNPDLRRMQAEIEAMQAEISVAYKENVPDFSLGVMADVKANPIMVRPLAGMTLPIWRDKVAAGIARTKAAELAAQARLSAEEIDLTLAMAEKTFAYREVTRNLELLQHQLIPKAGLSVEIARAGYLSGTISFFNLIDAERTKLAFQLFEVEARTRREITLAELSLLITGIAPPSAPFLTDLGGENP